MFEPYPLNVNLSKKRNPDEGLTDDWEDE